MFVFLRISESVRAYAYLILSSQASARSSIVGNTASSLTAQSAFLNNFENVLNRRVDIHEDIKKATSPEGETKTFTFISEAAKELEFSERGVGKAFHEKRNRIGEYQLEWLKPEPDVDSEAALRIERLKKTFTRTVCVYCNKPLTREDRVKDGFGISKLNERLDIRWKIMTSNLFTKLTN